MSQREKDRIIVILTLLDQADQAVKQKRLTRPRGDNAAAYYRQVLKLQPGFEEAEQGLENIVDRYLEWSDAAVQQGRLDRARDYLLQARQINQQDPRLDALAQRLRQASKRGSGYTRLDSKQVKLRSAALVQVLGRLADQVRVENARVIIEAPTDAQGRWIYQQLNRRHEDYRIRANMRIDPQAGIRLLY
jgi:tetratricopeptide (TPR) repeat protein